MWGSSFFSAVSAFVSLALAQFTFSDSAGNPFQPVHRLSGIGVDRPNISDEVLTRRTDLMIESQTFSILRDPQAMNGAARITGPRLQKLFDSAEKQSGVPASVVSAIAYLESWGDATAQSPAGPRGIMQFSEATARAAGLRIIQARRYHVTKERVAVHRRKKTTYRTIRKKIPYYVTVRDERLIPEKAIPAAANYLARMQEKFGGIDWAIFAYHCGEGCVADFKSMVPHASGMDEHASVAKVFFSANPAYNRDIYEAIRHHMDRDFSPTYWFRIMKAQRLLALYKEDPKEFERQFSEYRNQDNPNIRAPHRLVVWLKTNDLYQTCDDIRRDTGKKLFKVFDDPDKYGFKLRTSGPGALGELDLSNQEEYLEASPAAIGTLAYIAFETHRLNDAMHGHEKFVPIDVTGLVRPVDYQQRLMHRDVGNKIELASHCTGQVFDISTANLPPSEREALQFVLNDMGWDGYLGFVEEASNTAVLHIGCAPSARDFFTEVFEDALGHKLKPGDNNLIQPAALNRTPALQ